MQGAFMKLERPHTPDAIRQRGAIFNFLKANKLVYENFGGYENRSLAVEMLKFSNKFPYKSKFVDF